MQLVEERSLSTILRSNLLTALINNDVSGKVNASGVPERFRQISRDGDVVCVGGERPRSPIALLFDFNEEISSSAHPTVSADDMHAVLVADVSRKTRSRMRSPSASRSTRLIA
jgi:hypothetical protein